MKTIAKLSMAALAAALTATATADDLKLETTLDAHGAARLQYRTTESPTIAVFAQGQSLGQQMGAEPIELRFGLRDNGHSGVTPQYFVVK